ncbi:sigma-54-dependent transcriptional regulator [Fundidesulfovibrio soli]|uniref:sigma-54-dependent transcriptional regulator n=1 Tax=Fundidesulfovibrio soli TaxID=2922716 RepID=UPI001FAF9FC6|nr:sigma-54 dependent transcriptional regulator [Fundidesulfovibrio soli]
MARILIVDDDEITRAMLSTILNGEGHTALTEPTLTAGLKRARSTPCDVLYLDVALPDGNGLEAVPTFLDMPSNPEVIIITSSGDPNGAEKAIRNGAWDYIEKSYTRQDILLSIRQALAYRAKKLDALPVKRGRIIGSSPQLEKCIQEMSQAARSNVSVLVYGETGVGKDLFAHALHENSAVSKGPFIIVDCASLHPSIASRELFGHKKGSFTSAITTNQGLIQQAHGGTLFLDEISELDLETQKIFLRVLESHRFRPLGEYNEVFCDFRFICASNRDLEAMVAQGTFRQDLFFRIREVTIRIPPLRERKTDLSQLIDHFLAAACQENDLPLKLLSPDLMRMFCSYAWPGNVRELSHVVRALVSASSTEEVIMPWHLPVELRAVLIRNSLKGTREGTGASHPPAQAFDGREWKHYRKESLETIEKSYFRSLVQSHEGDIASILAVSGLSQAQLYRLIKKHGLSLRPRSAASQDHRPLAI